MRFAAASALALLLASTAVAQLTPGLVVRAGEPFPFIADFNGDGLDDLIQEHNVILNNGGTFSDIRSLGLPSDENVIAILDANGDHRIDVLMEKQPLTVPYNVDPNAPHGVRTYRLYIADESRHFGTGIDVASGSPPYVADTDGDGRDDFIQMKDLRPDGERTVATEMTVLRSLGDGTFEHLGPFVIGGMPQVNLDNHILSADLNHDGMPDLVIRGVNDISILRGIGGGRFAVENRFLPQNSVFGVWSMLLADVDGDSNADIVLAGFRTINVFYGDGHGNFPRATRTDIPKLHDADIPDWMQFLKLDEMNQPRDLASGHFTNDQMQIAGATGEGDLVVLAYDGTTLKESSRTRSEFWLPAIRSGSFHAAGHRDLYAMGTLIWGGVYPAPRFFYGANDGSAAVTSIMRLPARGRAFRTTSPETALQIQIQGECIDVSSERWTFVRDGIFGVAQHGQTKIETVFEGPSTIDFRVTAPYTVEPSVGVLTESSKGTFSGSAWVRTSCGWKTMNVTATVQ